MRPMSFLQRNASAAFVAAGAGLIVAYLIFRTSPLAEAMIYETASVLGLLAVVVGLHWRGNGRVRAWWLFAAGVAAFAAGDVVWCVHDVLGVSLPSNHISDAFYLVSYPLFAAALIALSASRREPVESIFRQFNDAAQLFVSAFTATWFLVLDQAVVRADKPFAQTVLLVLYPTLDLALLALVARFAFSSGRWPLSYRLLTAAFALMFVGDLTWRVLLADGSYAVDSWINILFMAGYVLWGAAALHPSVTQISRFGAEAAAAKPGAGWRRLAVLAVGAVVPGLVLVTSRHPLDDHTDVVLFAAMIMLLPLLSLVRVGEMLRSLHLLAGDFDEIIGSSPAAICVVDREGTVQVWNRAAEVTSGYLAEEVVGGTAPIVPFEDAEQVALLYWSALQGTVHKNVDVTLLHRDGHAIDLRVSTAPLNTADGRIVALFEDVTLERRQQERISFLASHDSLTGLPNRRRFEQELEASSKSADENGLVHVVLLDVDNFKSLNDTGGHTVGDQVLRELAGLLEQTIRPADFLARLSGDEFALILNQLDHLDALTAVERLLDVARDYRLPTAGGMLDVTLSAGIYTVEPNDGGERALRRADEALYRAKEHGKNRLERWEANPIPMIGAARGWSPAIKDALREDRLDLYLQPIVSLSDGSVAFYEALCRLRSPDGEMLAAGQWIAHAERLGLMPSIDIRMLEKVQNVLVRNDELHVFVNLSSSSFHDISVLGRLERTLRSVPQGSLGIEITEHTTLSDRERATDVLTRFRALGAVVAIDDFGLGFTSFSELANLPCDIVKIPGSFGDGQSDDDTPAIAAAITSVAHHYGKSVVIEGIETAAAARQAKLLGIEYAQGWHYGKPAPASGSVPLVALPHAG
jgi:diguanylate cyclase (GGDEF)-like protein/PAS domain S-box-containing protein